MRWPRQNGKGGQVIICDVRSNGMAMDSEGYLGGVVAGGNGKGNLLDQLNGSGGVFVDNDNHRVMKWMKGARELIVLADGRGRGSSLSQLSYPWGIVVDQLGSVYAADLLNHRIVRWCAVVDGNGQRQGTNQLSWSTSLFFSEENNLYVTSSDGHRIQKFNVDVK
ncbi:unnamed protein product [Adineta ricciae]|uniref:Uncharacterized protein n=1 Tax=Adineta ricciae TaxID=249248 RepID=A0A815WVC3_ADIRI|nr:unnamed protein product [Adineta ricciae]CAF1549119.1 unnamed protein product [Adineta ricciae]